VLDAKSALYLAVESDQLVVFGDGIEADFVIASWGQRIQVHAGPVKLNLVH
jgi:hypothetical protein